MRDVTTYNVLHLCLYLIESTHRDEELDNRHVNIIHECWSNQEFHCVYIYQGKNYVEKHVVFSANTSGGSQLFILLPDTDNRFCVYTRSQL